jgi:TRAP-type C4-dicarboxylate transport system permease small subunit
LFAACVGWADRILGAVIIVIMSTMMIITVVDVVARYFFSAPLPASFEGTEVLLATLIFAGLPLVTARGRHITIDFVDRFVPSRWRRFHRSAVELLGGFVLAIVAWVVWGTAGKIAAAGLHTDILAIPFAPLAYFISVMVGLSAIVFLLSAFRGFLGDELGGE